jgi:hypothetical protein
MRLRARSPKQKPAGKPKPTEAPSQGNGSAGPEPTRYGDWEKKGIASDF